MPFDKKSFGSLLNIVYLDRTFNRLDESEKKICRLCEKEAETPEHLL